MVIVSILIGTIIGFFIFAILNACSEVDKISEIEVSVYRNKNKVVRILISKSISDKIKIGQEFVGREAEVVEQAINFFKGKYIERKL